MAQGNGRLTAKSVSVWFEAMPFDGQVALFGRAAKDSQQSTPSTDQRAQAAVGSVGKWLGNGHAEPNVPKRQPKKSNVKVKYSDPKTGGTWSGRGRMATWLAEKVRAGEKAQVSRLIR